MDLNQSICVLCGILLRLSIHNQDSSSLVTSAQTSKMMMLTCCGTLGYTAPEVLEHAKGFGPGYGPECDLWSVGTIAFILLSGVPPFYGTTDEEVIMKVSMCPCEWATYVSTHSNSLRCNVAFLCRAVRVHLHSTLSTGRASAMRQPT